MTTVSDTAPDTESSALLPRIIACFDVIDGRVTKARQFADNIDVAPASTLAAELYEQDVDELIFYDITASHERRTLQLEAVESVARRVCIPFTVGGGIGTVEQMHAVLERGAEKVSIDSMAVRRPALITEGANEFGTQCIVLSMQAARTEPSRACPSGYEIWIDGARVRTGIDAVEWARRGEALGAGEICVNSIDRDGTHTGYDLRLLRLILEAVNRPVIASGGAGSADHVAAGLRTGASGAIVSSLLYSPRLKDRMTVPELKRTLTARGFAMRAPVTPDPRETQA